MIFTNIVKNTETLIFIGFPLVRIFGLELIFGVNRSIIVKHIKNVYESGELEEVATWAIIAHVCLYRARSCPYYPTFCPDDQKIFSEGELDLSLVCAKFAHTGEYGCIPARRA